MPCYDMSKDPDPVVMLYDKHKDNQSTQRYAIQRNEYKQMRTNSNNRTWSLNLSRFRAFRVFVTVHLELEERMDVVYCRFGCRSWSLRCFVGCSNVAFLSAIFNMLDTFKTVSASRCRGFFGIADRYVANGYWNFLWSTTDDMFATLPDSSYSFVDRRIVVCGAICLASNRRVDIRWDAEASASTPSTTLFIGRSARLCLASGIIFRW
ncbi:Uncharacterized protein APZ42_014257 [Daphnia magna]|uniref:Uncharacterized protein n=1 Tax=Daphnia magna TaxID=35525 RepID=A0A162Q590_9CRUS|nr:Uncharacterized protein APZ42_014257 [Daphnia magna]